MAPESSPQDFHQDLKELAEAQNKKVEAQTTDFDFEKLEEDEQKLYEEADDILRIAWEHSENPDQFILDAIHEHAKTEKLPLICAKAQVLQYLSPEWKEKVDKEVMEYFQNFDLIAFAKLQPEDPKSKETIKILEILRDEGYMPYFVISVHYQDEPDKIKTNKQKYQEFTKNIRKTLKQAESIPFNEQESFVLDSQNTFPEARNFIQGIKNTNITEYNYAINLCYKYLIIGKELKTKFPEFDCNEQTLFLQKTALDESMEIGNYLSTNGHAVLRIDGFPLVLDTYDMRIRSIEECAKREGYIEGEISGYFWRDNENHYLAKYEKTENYPKKIIGYTASPSPYVVDKNEPLSGLIRDKAFHLASIGKTKEAKLHYEAALKINPNYVNAHYNLAVLLKSIGKTKEAKLHYEAALKINPNHVNAHYNLAVLLNSIGKTKEAKLHYEAALKINPNNADAHNNLAILLKSIGKTPEAKIHYKAALKINPNLANAHYGLAILLYQTKEYKESRKHLEQFNKLRNGNHEQYFIDLDQELKSKGY
ncbi:MAG: tetratricopeptide repeat protein [bacterium]|nr:tetratricopeptide repeat protein [bacterium]